MPTFLRLLRTAIVNPLPASSLITALMQKQSSKAIKTFNIGFHEKTLDESMHAKKIANHLGTEHYNVFFSNKDIINLIPTLSQVYDEPFADSSQLPTILLSQITKKKGESCFIW